MLLDSCSSGEVICAGKMHESLQEAEAQQFKKSVCLQEVQQSERNNFQAKNPQIFLIRGGSLRFMSRYVELLQQHKSDPCQLGGRGSSRHREESRQLPCVLLAFAQEQFVAKVLGCRGQQPVCIHQTQTPHVAAGRVQQLIEDHVGRLTLEEDGRRVDGHGLVGVQSQVGAVRLKLRGVDEHAVGEAASNILRVSSARLQLQVQLENTESFSNRCGPNPCCSGGTENWSDNGVSFM